MEDFVRLLALSEAASIPLAPADGTRAQLLTTGNDENLLLMGVEVASA